MPTIPCRRLCPNRVALVQAALLTTLFILPTIAWAQSSALRFIPVTSAGLPIRAMRWEDRVVPPISEGPPSGPAARRHCAYRRRGRESAERIQGLKSSFRQVQSSR